MSDLIEKIELAKELKNKLSNSNITIRNNVLSEIAKSLDKNRIGIIAENKKDIDEYSNYEKMNISILERLIFDDKKIDTLIRGINDLIELEDPLNKLLFERNL
ncbi:MAG: gamma-glutamyl-phosphate reductase, partial [Clostridiales Family XIII bacterium]|nr:gamma-glutamyl-phosphate reductase [Clostridiales Family XIII bacterium]